MRPSQRLRRDAVLREMGLGPVWRLRARAEAHDEAEADAAAGQPPGPVPILEVDATRVPEAVTPVARPAAATPFDDAPLASRHETLTQPTAADRPPPHTRQATPTRHGPAPESVSGSSLAGAVDGDRAARIARLDWDALEADMRDCQACRLCQRRRQVVPGVGDREASLMLVGEGPGAEEDQRGEPFVGQAGRLLDNMLAAIGLRRGEDVYIANAVKCRPPHNRTPERGEMAACLPYLDRQIALVQPRLLLALGRPAAQALLDREVAISAARGKRFERNGIPVIVTYHPAYLLRNPQDKAKAWEDLCFARRCLAEAAAGR
ncbi:uracil-DNA glycosylase [Thauera sp.]|uniref:uracil-DNA glycosylase n=1 Tax=Thauera sp. TaxID=1905334 RepID=UPI002B7CAD57|nr:uracil-DNA glycosylase [Thauera sp.]HRP26337.1 uracil-DNA glycosylase [Thauera sp.]